MRLTVTLTAAALALSGCVVQNPGMQRPAPLPPPVVKPNPDVAIRNAARPIISRQLAGSLPGTNIAPYTDCVIANASTAELDNIANSSDPNGAVATIVDRPGTTQCIADAAAAARSGMV